MTKVERAKWARRVAYQLEAQLDHAIPSLAYVPERYDGEMERYAGLMKKEFVSGLRQAMRRLGRMTKTR